MAKLSELRKQAKDMGIAASVIRSATTASELQSVISDHSEHSKPRKKAAVRKASVRKASARKSTPVRKARTTSTRNTRKASGRKASTPAKSRGTAKRSSNSKPKGGYEPKGGRNLLDSVDFNKTDGWNAREGSAPDRIIKALRKFRGNRTKVYEYLKADVWDFVGKVKANGQKRTLAEARDMLKYRISRTAWDFAMRTEQHEVADNRVEYGTGGTGAGTWKPAKKVRAQKASKPAAKKASTKPARKPATRQKASQARTTARKSGGWKPGSRGRVPASATKAQIREHNRLRKVRAAA